MNPNPLEISSLSREYVRVSVRAVEGGVSYDPTGSVVEMAFIAAGEPGALDWKDAEWEASQGPIYTARCLVGPAGTVTLADGTYQVWIRIVDDPEQPVKQVGELIVV